MKAALCLALIISIFGAFVPVQAAQPPVMKKMYCCSQMAVKQNHHCDDPVPCPNQSRDQQCCAACAVGLALIGQLNQSIAPPTAHPHSYRSISEHALVRTERPPVPPPRFELS